uniref:Uncharacterized protein n=1 Tax=Fagus sylvatica TaxID=28930 RepID=A0A2N9ETZ2_FAGSY
MGKFAKLVDTEEKIVEFKKRYGIPEDVHIRYVPYGDLALVLNQDLVLPMVAIIEGGIRNFTSKKVELVERRTVEHLLQKPCFIDSGGRPRAASVLLDYVPSYKSFQKGPIVKHFRQEEVSVVRPGKDQEDIIQAVPLTARKGVQPVFRSFGFRLFLTPILNPTEEMPVQPRTVSIADVLGTSAPETSRTSLSASPLPLPPGFSQGEGVMRKKRKRGTAQDDEGCVQEGSSPPQPSKAKSPKKAKSKNNRALQKATGQIPQGRLGPQERVEEFEEDKWPKQLEKLSSFRKDMKVWQEKRSKYMLENLKRDSILAVQGIFEAGNRLLETERRLNLSTDEIKRLKDLESSASVRIRAAESAQKSAEAASLKRRWPEAEVRADKGAQAYYDQGVNQASQDLRYQLRGECNKYFVQGWHQALDNAGVDDDSDLYDLAYSRQPYEVPVSEEGNELEAGEGVAGDPTVLGSPEALSEPVLVDDTKAAEDRPDDQIPAAESQEGEEGSDVDETIDVVD